MVLEVDPAAPAWLHVAASTLLYAHISGGAVGMVSGAAALALPKGGRAHRLAGRVFVVSMMIMAGIGAAVAPFLPERASILGGLVTFYLVATAWLTVMRPAGTIGRLEPAAFAAAAALAVMAAILGTMAALSPTGTLDGQPWQAFVLFNVITPLAAAGDLKLVLRRGISGAQRLARHLWRMCTALYIAVGSFFLGQPDSLPAFMRDTALPQLPPILVLLMLGWWLVRVRFSRRLRHGRTGPAPASTRPG